MNWANEVRTVNYAAGSEKIECLPPSDRRPSACISTSSPARASSSENPEAPAVQQKFAASRGWKFRMVSHMGTSFAADMGYRSADGRWRPGVSVFKRAGPKTLRVSDASWSPGDDFCTVWHFFDLLPGGAAGWAPKLSYP